MNVEQLTPGTLIQLNSIADLAVFEDTIAEQIDPDMSPTMRVAWMGRAAIKDLIRPPKFNGTIANIGLVVMEEPYEQLLTARERGWKFNHGKTSQQISSKENVTNSLKGFTFIADAHSNGRGIIGQIQAELWFSEVPAYEKKNNTQLQKNTTAYGGRSVRRIITKPKIEEEKFYKLQKESERIGWAVLRAEMMRPITTPMTQ